MLLKQLIYYFKYNWFEPLASHILAAVWLEDQCVACYKVMYLAPALA